MRGGAHTLSAEFKVVECVCLVLLLQSPNGGECLTPLLRKAMKRKGGVKGTKNNSLPISSLIDSSERRRLRRRSREPVKHEAPIKLQVAQYTSWKNQRRTRTVVCSTDGIAFNIWTHPSKRKGNKYRIPQISSGFPTERGDGFRRHHVTTSFHSSIQFQA